MKTFDSISKANSFLKKGSAIAIGNYDGIHYGHRSILKKLIKEGKKNKFKTALLTFRPHPAKTLAPETSFKLINTYEQKNELLKETGIDAVIFHKFDKRFAKTSPEKFFEKYLIKELSTKTVFVGHDFTFGDQRSGTIETLEHLGGKHNIKINIMPDMMLENTLVSSSLIRKLLMEGQVKLANKLLTRLFFIDGKVVHGFQRGTSLGMHTANLKTKNELIPNDGVYATKVQIGRKKYSSVTNIGFNPTFDNKNRSIETHILNFDQNIYKKTIRLSFVDKIRDEIRFATPTALVKQIEKDIEKAKKILGV